MTANGDMSLGRSMGTNGLIVFMKRLRHALNMSYIYGGYNQKQNWDLKGFTQ